MASRRQAGARPILESLVVSCLAALCLFALGLAAPVAAQEDVARTAGARALFQEGIAHARAGSYEEAAERFRAALALRDAPAVRFNLAAALVELGQLGEADALVSSVLADPDARTLQAPAGELRLRIVESAGFLEVTLDGDPTGVSVRLDDREVDPSRLGGSLPVGPGDHVVEAFRGEGRLHREETHVALGETATVGFTIVPAPEPVIPPVNEVFAEPVREPEPVPEADEGGGLWVWAAAGGAAVVVAVVAVVVLGGGTEAPVEGDFQPGVLTW